MNLLNRLKKLETQPEAIKHRAPTPDEIAARAATIMNNPAATPLHRRVQALLATALRRKAEGTQP